ncbi:MAG: regulatory protein RecX [Spirochaetales bacterium]|nr:regulatory protein RecX [Spirochaetales bacterium]
MQENDSSSPNVNTNFPIMLSSLKPLGKGGKILCTFSNNTSLVLFKEIILEESLHEDDEITEKKYLNLVQKQENNETLQRGLRLLALRVHSEKEIRQKLVLRGFPQTSIDYTVNYLYKYSWLDDTEFARQWVQSRLRKTGFGRSRLKQELYSKGVHRDIINTVLAETYPAETEQDQCRAYLQKISRTASFTQEKLIQKLLRRGFAYPVIKKVMASDIDIT